MEGADGSLEEKNMKSLLAATAVAALAFGFAEAANAAPAVGGVNGVRAGESTNLVQQAAYYHVIATAHGAMAAVFAGGVNQLGHS